MWWLAFGSKRLSGGGLSFLLVFGQKLLSFPCHVITSTGKLTCGDLFPQNQEERNCQQSDLITFCVTFTRLQPYHLEERK